MVTIDGIEYALDAPETGEATITGPNTTTLTEIIVPAIIESGGTTYLVTKIATNAFQNNTTITSIDFSGASNLKIIDQEAFMNTPVININFSGATNLVKILGNAFNNTHVTSLDFRNLVNLEQIFIYSFRFCTELTSVNFGNNPKLIGGGTNTGQRTFFAPFENCSNLPTIDLSTTVIKEIGNSSFEKCSSLISAKLPSTVIRFANKAFYDTGLTEISIPSSVETMSGEIFRLFVTNFVVYWDDASNSALTNCASNAFSSSNTGLKVVYLNVSDANPPTSYLVDTVEDFYPTDKFTIYYSPFTLDAPIISSNYSASSINLDGSTITFRLIFPQPFTAPLSEANDVSSYIVTEEDSFAQGLPSPLLSQPSTPQSQHNGYTFLFGNLDDSNTTITVHTTNSFPSSGTIIIEDEFISYTDITSTTFTGCTRGAFGSTAASHTNKSTVYEAVIITFTAQQGQSSFRFQVQAKNHNDEDISDLSNTSNILTIPGTPDISTAFPVVITYRTVTLGFTEPASPGAEITGYEVEANSGGVLSYPNVSVETAPGVSPAIILIEGLTGETTYTFKIKAINNIGESSYSNATNPIITLTPLPPDAPVTINATATGLNTATLEFTEPNDNGADIISYTVQATTSPGGVETYPSFTETNISGEVTLSIEGLKEGTIYTFKVLATNIKGPSPYSAESNSIPTFNVPGPCVVNNVIVTGQTTASIIFTPPSDTGNSPITYYTATSTPGNITSTLYVNKSINNDINTTMNMERATQLTIYMTGLTPGTTYTFVVIAFNAYGASSASNIFRPVTTDPEPSLTTFNIRRSRASYGQFWFGKSIGFPGFLYKKNNGVGGRRSTTMAPGGNSNCNTYQNVNNSYTPGSGVGGSSIAVRRAKRKYATIQTMNQYL